MPKENEIEIMNREVAMKKAGIYALEIPLSVAEKCLSILKHQIEIAKYGNKNAISDIGVGSLLALAGLEGAAMNVKINLPGIGDDDIRKDASEKIADYISEGSTLKSEIMKIVDTRMG
jgi:formiminotetrahydrofolate cyclodeaminase